MSLVINNTLEATKQKHSDSKNIVAIRDKGEKNKVIVFYYQWDLYAAAGTKNILYWVSSWCFESYACSTIFSLKATLRLDKVCHLYVKPTYPHLTYTTIQYLVYSYMFKRKSAIFRESRSSAETRKKKQDIVLLFMLGVHMLAL